MGLEGPAREMLTKLDKNHRARLARIRKEWKQRHVENTVADADDVQEESSALAIIKGKRDKVEGTKISHDIADAGSDVMIHMRKAFYPVIIRRTRNSRDNNGDLISGLPEPKLINVFAKFTDEEEEKFDEVVARVKRNM